MFMIDWKDIGWWYWLTLSTLLNLSVYGVIDGYILAITVAALHFVHYAIRESSLTAFSVQVRTVFLFCLLASYPEPMQWLYWVPAIGTIARVLFGYCILARILMLFPANRTHPLSWNFAMSAIFSRPIRGNVKHGLGKYRDISITGNANSASVRA